MVKAERQREGGGQRGGPGWDGVGRAVCTPWAEVGQCGQVGEIRPGRVAGD